MKPSAVALAPPSPLPLAVARVPLLGLAGTERPRLDEKGRRWSIDWGGIGSWLRVLGCLSTESRKPRVALGRFSLLVRNADYSVFSAVYGLLDVPEAARPM